MPIKETEKWLVRKEKNREDEVLKIREGENFKET